MVQRFVAAGTGPLELIAIGLIVVAKFALPILIIRFPFAAGWANFVLDGIDGDLLIPLGLLDATYQPVDKLSDWVTYAAIVVLAYRDAWPIRRLILGLFLFRSIGQVGFLLTGNELLLAAFPNFLEPLFLVTVTILAWARVIERRADWRDRGFAILHRYRWVIGALIVIYKLQDEYVTHVADLDRSDWFRGLFGG
jgi:hypothetical protein